MGRNSIISHAVGRRSVGPDFCRGLNPSGVGDYDRSISGLHVQRVCDPRPALDLFCTGPGRRPLQVSKVRTFSRLGVRWGQNLAGPLRLHTCVIVARRHSLNAGDCHLGINLYQTKPFS